MPFDSHENVQRERPRILFVDDKENVLLGLQRVLRRSFAVDIAVGAQAGLALIKSSPYAVVVSDLCMPGMDGIQFLKRVKELRPDVVRFMLSGQADLQGVIEAVNEGHIFQFLLKPCSEYHLRRALEAGIHQHDLIAAERDLFEQTLGGSIALMTEVLAAIDPTAFGGARRIRNCVRHMAEQLALENFWEVDLAAMFSSVGFVTADANIPRGAPVEVHSALAQVPRLQTVAEMVHQSTAPFHDLQDAQIPREIALGAQMIRTAKFLDRALSAGESHASAIRKMQSQPDIYDPALVDILKKFDAGPGAAILAAILEEPQHVQVPEGP
jgi:CheY-like chemotaxis protein